MRLSSLPSNILRLAFLLLFLAACNGTAPDQVGTETPASTVTAAPTATPTYTPTLAPIILGDFSAKLEGVGTNGTMVCITYPNAADLEGLSLTADIGQGGRWIETAIPSQQMDGRTCFELVDVKYVSVDPDDGTLIISEDPITLQITATSPDDRQVQNGTQFIDLGPYVQFPFMQWIYETDRVCRASGDSHRGYIAWDFLPYPTTEHPTLVGTPIFAPVDGIVLVVPGDSTQSGQNYSVMIYSPTTGYLIDLTHNAQQFIDSDGAFKHLSDLAGNYVTAGDVVAMIGLKDTPSFMPHTHMQIVIPSDAIDVSGLYNSSIEIFNKYISNHSFPNIDPIISHLFLDENLNNYLNSLPNSIDACGGFTWGTLPTPPQQLPITIDGNPDDWAGYTPVLTDALGDSELGSVMDLTELYTASDDNYLYLMLKAGSKPSTEWYFDFYLDTAPGDQCGAADKLLEIWSQRTDSFTINSLNGCSSADDTALYSSQYKWSNVLEIRIPLFYLEGLDISSIVKIEGGNNDGAGNWSVPDTMP